MQNFFNQHPDFLINDDYANVHPHLIFKDSFGKSLIPDYVIEPISQGNLSDLIDIKLPTEKIFVSNKRPRFSVSINKVCSQLREYNSFFDNPENRKRVQEEYGLTLYNPKMITIIGRRWKLDPLIYKNVQKNVPELKIITYDDIVDRMKHKIK